MVVVEAAMAAEEAEAEAAMVEAEAAMAAAEVVTMMAAMVAAEVVVDTTIEVDMVNKKDMITQPIMIMSTKEVKKINLTTKKNNTDVNIYFELFL